MKEYIALTIGPVYKTLSSAKKTGELWAGSYIFSYLMKEIIKEFKGRDVILPAISDDLFKKDEERFQGAGFFPDRFIFASQNGDLEKLKTTIDNAIINLAKNISKQFQESLETAKKYMQKLQHDKDKKDNFEFYQKKVEELSKVQNSQNEIEKYLKEYFNIHFFEKAVQDPIDDIYPLLDILELQQNVIHVEEINYLSLFMKNINNSFLKDDAKLSGDTFPSLPYIATKALHENLKNIDEIFDISNDDTKIYENIASQINLKNHHKYIAIVQADGDNIGSVISYLSGDQYQAFNKKLLDFTSKSNQTVKAYGGSVIYAGGDDLLFFAPVIGRDGHIFQLLQDIRKNFNEELKDYIKTCKEKNKKLPSVSFGLSISYYKYPLYEALQDALKALEHSKNSGKNATTMRLLQHSGQYIQSTLQHETDSYDNFEKLTDEYLNIDDEKSLLSSFHHTIRKFEDVLKAIADDTDSIKSFFENNFNDAHKKQYEKFLNLLVQYIQTIFSEESDEDKAIEKLYTTLKMIKFLKGAEI